MEFLSDYGLFLLKTITAVIALLILVAGMVSITRKQKQQHEVTSLNKEFEEMQQELAKQVMAEKLPKKKKSKEKKPRLYVLDFQGDIKASQVDQLREEITMVLAVAKPEDEVLVRIDSPGGSVNGYGLAACFFENTKLFF